MTKSTIESLYDITQEVLNRLDGLEHGDITRDEAIGEITNLIEQRQALMASLTGPYSAKEKEYGQAMLSLNQTVEEKMQLVFKAIKMDMLTFKQNKVKNKTYINPYGKVTTIDGMYIDSKQ